MAFAKTIMKTNTISNMFTRGGIFALMLIAVIVVMPVAAHAQEDDGGDYSGSCCGGSDLTGIDYSTQPNYSSDLTGIDYSVPASNGSDLTGIDYSYPASYGSDLTGVDYSYPANDSYTASGYSVSSYGGGWYGGGGSGYSSSNTWNNGNTNIYAPSQTNTCTAGNSCNTNIVTNTTNPAPIVYNTTPVVYTNPAPVYSYGYNYGYNTETCNTCGCLGYPVCPTVAYNNPTPYVTLSQVPYTGLDLGFWGTIAYWSFLVLWALAAAYLIVIKRVQNRLFYSMKNFLFGSTELTTSGTAMSIPVAHQTSASALDINALAIQIEAILNPMVATSNGMPTHVGAAVAPKGDYVDSFIMTQINRKRS